MAVIDVTFNGAVGDGFPEECRRERGCGAPTVSG